MNYTQLQQAIIDDTHKSQYVGAPVQRFIEQGEALIRSLLESFNFQAQLLDANRVSASSPIYNLPARLTHLRYVRINGLPLDKIDETSVYLRQNISSATAYVQRSRVIQIVANPALLTGIDIDYMGMPEALAVVDSNTLLTDYPQLYIDAASVYVYKRAENLEMGEIAMQSVVSMCNNLNRIAKKLLGGAQSAPVYNTQFRSSY